MEDETSSLKAALQGMLNAIRGDDEQLTDFREKVMQLLRSTESAVRTFQRSKLWRDAPQQFKGGRMNVHTMMGLVSCRRWLAGAVRGMGACLVAIQRARVCVSLRSM